MPMRGSRPHRLHWTPPAVVGALVVSLLIVGRAQEPAFAQRQIFAPPDGPRIYGNPVPVPGEIPDRVRTAGSLRSVVRIFRSGSGALIAELSPSTEGSALPAPVWSPTVGADVPPDETVVLDIAGDGLIRFQVNPAGARRLIDEAEHGRRVRLDPGMLGDLLATVVNHDGTVQARVIVERAGVIRLLADPRTR
jgi:hypothetical protein